MSFLWDQIEKRESAKKETEKALKDFLRSQNEQDKLRKVEQKQAELNEARKLFGQSPVPLTDKVKKNDTIGQILKGTVALSTPGAPAISANSTKDSQIPSSYQSQYPPPPSSSLPALPPLPSIPLTLPSSTTQSMTSLQTQPAFTNAAQYNDILTKLKYTEDQLQSERKTRLSLETELHSGKTLLSALSARLEKLSDIVLSDGHVLRETTRRVAESEERARNLTQQVSSKCEGEFLRMNERLNELLSKQRSDDSYKQEQEERNRSLLAEVNDLKFRLEATTQRANQVSTDFTTRSREWDSELARTMDVIRSIREHENALHTLSTTVDSTTESVSRKIDAVLLDLRMKLESESRARTQFEQSTREMYSEARRAQQSSERDLTDKLDSAKQSIFVSMEKDKKETERAITAVADHLRKEKQALQESQSALLEKLALQSTIVEKHLESDRQQTKSSITRLEAAMEEGFKIVHQALSKRTEEVARSQENLKSQIAQAVKSLQESVYLVEKSFEQKLSALEEIVRVEIKARMDTDAGVESLAQEVGLKLERYDKNLTTFKEGDTKQLQHVQKSLLEEVSKLKESVQNTQNNLLVNLNDQMRPLYDVMKELQHRISECGQTNSDLSQKIERLSAERKSNELDQSLNDKIEGLQYAQETTSQTCKELEIILKTTHDELSEKLQLRAAQMDATMEAFKQELIQRVKQDDLDASETRVQLAVNNVHKISDYLQSELQAMKSDLEQTAKLQTVEALQSKVQILQQDQRKNKEDTEKSISAFTTRLSECVTRKEAASVDERTKKVVNNLQAKELEIEEIIRSLKAEMTSKPTKQAISELDQKIVAILDDHRSQLKNLETTVKEHKYVLTQKGSRKELEESVKAVTTAVKDWNEKQWNETSSLLRTMEDLLRHDFIQETTKIVADLEPSINSVLQLAQSMEEAVQLCRQEMHEQANQQKEALVQFSTAHSDLVDEAKQSFQNQFKEFERKLDHFPRKTEQLESQINDSRLQLTKQFEAKQILITKAISDVRKATESRLAEIDIESIKSEYTTALSKLSSKLDSEMSALAHLRTRMEKTEKDALARIDSAVAGIGHRIEELDGEVKRLDAGHTTLAQDTSDLRQVLNMKPIDWCVKEIRTIRQFIDKDMEVMLTKYAQELSEIKQDMDTFVSVRDMERAVDIHLSPVKNHLDRVRLDVQELRVRLEERRPYYSYRQEESHAYLDEAPETRTIQPVTQSSVHKPTLAKSSSIPRMASRLESSRPEQSRNEERRRDQQNDDTGPRPVTVQSNEELPVGRPSITSEVPIEY